MPVVLVSLVSMASVAAVDVSNNSNPLRNSLWVAIVLAIILLCTRAVELGDTQVYAKDIVNHLGKWPFGPANSLWESGHLLWRPLGWVLLSLAAPLLSVVTDWTPFMQATFVLIAVSVPCALITVVLWHRMITRVGVSKSVAFMVTIAMACSHGFLLRAPSGSAYLPGLLCLTGSLCFLGTGRIIGGAVLYAVSALLWLPFILVGPALLLLAACPSWKWDTPVREILAKVDWARAIRFIAVSAGIVLLMYGLALCARRTSSVREAKDWYASGSHGYSTNLNVVRIATGLPRSFLYLGKDGIFYKRYLLHDPYSPVTLWDIVHASLWKIAAFDLFVACLLYELLRQPRSGWLLVLSTAGVAPVVLFAVTMLETGSPERYLPALPFVVVATAWVLRDFPATHRVSQVAIAAFLLCVVLTNIYSFAAPRVAAANSESLARVADLRSRLSSVSSVMLATNQDNLEGTLNRLAFDKISTPTPIRLYDLIEPGNTRVLTWRQDFAARTLKVWGSGGDVWVSKRVWSPRPVPAWNWVEGDDRRVSWKELPQLFSTLNTDAESGGPDGFLRLARDPTNLALLTPLAAGVEVPNSK